jgi:hypothetical protein
MNFIASNWEIFAGVIVFLAGGIAAVHGFFLSPSAEQLAKVSKWLLWAVSEAERALGDGTGKLKLSLVYDKFLKSFPWVSRIVTVQTFERLVDAALEKMREMLEDNPKVVTVIKGEQTIHI